MGLFESAARKALRKSMEYEIIEPDDSLKFVYLTESPEKQPELLSKLLAIKCVGFIYYKELTHTLVTGGYGVPVRIKNRDPKNK